MFDMLKNIFWLSLVALLLSTGLKSQTTVIWSDNFESDKSWDLQGNFFRNTSGTVGSYSLGSVLGTARNGNYSNDLTKNSNYAQTVNIDCSSHASVNLIFGVTLVLSPGMIMGMLRFQITAEVLLLLLRLLMGLKEAGRNMCSISHL